MNKKIIFAFLALTALLTAKAQQQVQVPYNGSVSITVPAGCTINGTTVTCPVTTPPVVVTPPPGPSRAKFIPTGGDDQKALYSAASKGLVEVGCPSTAGCTMKLSTSTLPDGADIYFDDGVTVTDFTAYSGWSHLFAISGNKGINLTGSGLPTAALIQMPLTFAQGNIQNNCVWIGTSSNINIIGLRFDKCGEDSIYIGNGSTNVHVSHVTSTNPLRNGCSVTDKVTNILIDFSDFSGAKNLAGGIADGCDAEPNGPNQATPIPGQFVKQVVFDQNNFHDNAGDGLCLCFWFTNSSVPLDYTVTNNKADNNGQKAYNKDSWPSPMNGTVKQNGNTANGKAATFQ